MPNYNTILIKRRQTGGAGAPASLSAGELAFNEINSTLYYGSNTGVIAIAGDGTFVNLTSAQSISGVKTFVDEITLPNAPINSTGAANRGYVDSEISTLNTNLTTTINSVSSDLQSQISNINNTSIVSVSSLSAEVYNTFVKLTDDRAVTLTNGLSVTGNLDSDTINTTGNVDVGGNLTVTGDLTVLGAFSQLETTTTVTSAFSVVNGGSQTALTVEQTGSFDVAEFIDDGSTALIIKNGGNVGVGVDVPNEKLTVSGNISATGVIYSASGLEIGNNIGISTLYVENGKVGINTETPNEELTVVGSISATEDIFARNGDFTGTINVDGASTFESLVTINDNTTTTGNISGTAYNSYLVDFIIDGGVF